VSALVDLESATYAPGDTLRGRVELVPLEGDASRKVELSVLWETEGKGDTDVGVILHRVLSDGDSPAARGTHRFEVELPALPLSQASKLLKIRWRVRVRRLATLGEDDVFDTDFRLAWPA
jgi:hypothetical protein